MTQEHYRRILSWIRGSTRRTGAVIRGMRVLVGMYLFAYVSALGYLLWRQETSLLWRCVLVPPAGFCVISVFRRIRNAPRPCEVYDIEPLLERDRPGRSFPSRHAFSACIIAMVLLRICMPAGIVFLILGAVLGALRVVSGLHFIRDVLAGAAVAVLIGGFGLFL